MARTTRGSSSGSADIEPKRLAGVALSWAEENQLWRRVRHPGSQISTNCPNAPRTHAACSAGAKLRGKSVLVDIAVVPRFVGAVWPAVAGLTRLHLYAMLRVQGYEGR